MITQLEAELGEDSSIDLGQVPVPSDPASFPDVRPSESRNVNILPDQFFGMTQSQAAKAYLQRVKRAVSIDQIVEALRSGGAQLGGADPKKTLYVSLARNPQREFVIPREGYFGLREFYPNLPKAASKPNNRNSRKLQKPGPKAGPKKAATKPAAKEQPVKAAVLGILKNGEGQTLEQISEAVQKQLGRIVAKIGIAATLRGKEFVKEGDRYRLA